MNCFNNLYRLLNEVRFFISQSQVFTQGLNFLDKSFILHLQSANFFQR